jgi:DNA polymerase-4
VVGRRRGSIGSQHACGRSRRSRSPAAIDEIVVGLVVRVTRRMRAASRVGRTVVLRLRFDDFTRATRSHTLPHATANTDTVLATVRGLVTAVMPKIARDGVTLVGVAVGNLSDDAAVQLALPFERKSGGALDAAVDGVRDKFGSRALTRAVLLGKRTGEPMPMLPD